MVNIKSRLLHGLVNVAIGMGRLLAGRGWLGMFSYSTVLRETYMYNFRQMTLWLCTTDIWLNLFKIVLDSYPLNSYLCKITCSFTKSIDRGNIDLFDL